MDVIKGLGWYHADGLSTVALFTLMMDRCRAHSPGTDYSMQASLMVLVTGIVHVVKAFLPAPEKPKTFDPDQVSPT